MEVEILMTVKDVARRVQVPPSTVYKLVREKKLPHLRIGKHLRFRPVDIQKWLISKVKGKSR